MEEMFVHKIPNKKNLSHSIKMCYGLRDIRHRSGTTESAQQRYLISCIGHGFGIRLVGRLPPVKKDSNGFSRIR
jgi:hypothetical protein